MIPRLHRAGRACVARTGPCGTAAPGCACVARVSYLCTRLLLVALLLLPAPLRAGGPLYVAGVTGFNQGLAGTPLTWANGAISYYTDQGDLSLLLKQADANALVAEAFSRWTSVPTAALAATRTGQLDEDVSSANVTRSGDTITLPADIQPNSAKPLAIVYDADGRVIDALLGSGAGSAQLCAANSVIGGADRFTSDAHIAHALLILNGNCALTSADLPLLRYRLVRMIGRVLGLDWSQLNDNVVSGSPSPTADDYAGFPLMHPSGAACSAGYGCILNADQPKPDDRGALSRLYPVTAANAASFSGKKVFSDTTARIRGSVRFPAWAGLPGQGMQGVNVVARFLDPATGKASHAVATSSVSGFLFRGNAGNPATGFIGGTGERFDRFGSDDSAKEGFFDLAGLEIPDGSSSASYELRTEAVNPAYTGSSAVGPYKGAQVSPSGASDPVIVTVTRGGDLAQDIVMRGGPFEPRDTREPHSFLQPSPIPGGGQWMATLSGYGDVDYHRFTAHAGRSFSLEVTAVNEANGATDAKACPVLALWPAAATDTASPLASQTHFNTGQTGLTRLQTALSQGGDFKFAIADYRGAGRPDFLYRARLLYADTVTPARATTAGGTALTITGAGFVPGTKVRIASAEAQVISTSPEEIVALAPALTDGVKSLTIEDPATGATTVMTDALSYGAAPADHIVLVSGGANPQVPVGAVAPNPLLVRVVGADNVTPVEGATVIFSAPAGSVSLSPCGGASCTLATNALGEAQVAVTVKTTGATAITVALASGLQVTATVSGITSALAISAIPPSMYVAKGTTTSVPLPAQVVGNGAPLAGQKIDYELMLGHGTLSAASATTDAAGQATVTLNLTSLASEVRVSACVAPGDNPCAIFHVFPVSGAGAQLQKLSGDQQLVSAGHAFAPLLLRVVDANNPPNAVSGVPVQFRVTAFRAQDQALATSNGEVTTTHFTQPVVLASSTMTVNTDGAGLAAVTPQFPAEWGALQIQVQAWATGVAAQFTLHTYVGSAPAPSSAQVPAPPTSSDTSRPTRSPSRTTGGCSAASAPSAPRRGSKASSTAPSCAEE